MSDNPPENPSAFPSQPLSSAGMPLMEAEPGMTLRDYFAGQSLTGLLHPEMLGNYDIDRIASEAYLLADAMLAARTTRSPDKP